MPAGTEESGKRERVLELLEEEAFLRSQLTVAESDYRDSVLALVRLAQGDASGSRTAAQVLLSLYDGSEWHMDLTDLGVLDWGYLQHALIVIRGRMVLGQSVEAVIDDGDQVFRRVWTPPLLQAFCSTASRYDCLRVSGLIDNAVLIGIGP